MSSVAAVEAWSTFALAILALIAAWYARGQVGEARAFRKAAGRAYVVIDAEGDKPTRTINLVLVNAGQSHAENVTVRFEPPLEAASTAIDHVETTAVWNQPVMPPGKRIRTVLDVGPDRAKSDLPMEYHAVVRYDSPATDETGIEQTYRIDLEASAFAIRQWDLVDQDTPKQTRALESIARTLNDLAAGFEDYREGRSV